MRLETVHYEVTNSTQLQAYEQEGKLQPGVWRAIDAEEQTTGIGSHGRTWVAPAKVNVYVTYSFLEHINKISKVLHFIPLVTAWSVLEVVSKKLSDDKVVTSIKWPNDVLLNKMKMSGILLKSSYKRVDNNEYMVVHNGIGININMLQKDCEEIHQRFGQPVTSMRVMTGKTFDKNEILENLTSTLYLNINLLMIKGFCSFAEAITNKLEKFEQKEIIFDSADDGTASGLVKGKIIGIQTDGQLVIEGYFLQPKISEDKEVKKRPFISGRILRGQEEEKALLKLKPVSVTGSPETRPDIFQEVKKPEKEFKRNFQSIKQSLAQLVITTPEERLSSVCQSSKVAVEKIVVEYNTQQKKETILLDKYLGYLFEEALKQAIEGQNDAGIKYICTHFNQYIAESTLRYCIKKYDPLKDFFAEVIKINQIALISVSSSSSSGSMSSFS